MMCVVCGVLFMEGCMMCVICGVLRVLCVCVCVSLWDVVCALRVVRSGLCVESCVWRAGWWVTYLLTFTV